MAQQNATVEVETDSPIESGIDESWESYAYVDDGEFAMVLGVSYVERREGGALREGDHRFRCALYLCEAGLVDLIKGPSHRTLQTEDVHEAAQQIFEELDDNDDRTPIEAARDYWSEA